MDSSRDPILPLFGQHFVERFQIDHTLAIKDQQRFPIDMEMNLQRLPKISTALHELTFHILLRQALNRGFE